MMSSFFRLFTLAAPVLFGLMAGFLFAFSAVVMPGLDLLDSASAISAMQGINVAVRNGVFLPLSACHQSLGLWRQLVCYSQGSAAAQY